MKARVMMIGDYDEDSKTYAICLIAEESEVDASPLKEGDEVEMVIANAEAHGRAASASPPAAGSAFNPDFGWYCPTCQRAVQNEHVTFQETHDPRCGGCGNAVEPNAKSEALT